MDIKRLAIKQHDDLIWPKYALPAYQLTVHILIQRELS